MAGCVECSEGSGVNMMTVDDRVKMLEALAHGYVCTLETMAGQYKIKMSPTLCAIIHYRNDGTWGALTVPVSIWVSWKRGSACKVWSGESVINASGAHISVDGMTDGTKVHYCIEEI